MTTGMPGMLTIKAALERSCRWFAERPALVEGERIVTYEELGIALRSIAGIFGALGVRKGDRVAFLSTASVEHTLAFYAAQRMGAITVNLHVRETPAYQIKLFQRLQPKVLIYDASFEGVVTEVISEYSDVRLVCVGGSSRTNARTLGELLRAGDAEPDVEVQEEDPAIIQLSSGSTGLPKALVHSHGSVLESWTGGVYMWSGIMPEDCFLNAFSPSFVVWLVHAGAFLAHGGCVVLQKQWNAASFLEAVQARGVTCAALTPTQWGGVLASEVSRYDLSSLRVGAYLGERMPVERLKELTAGVCRDFRSFYGMSECLGIGGCVLRSKDLLERGKWKSVGKPSINSDLRVSEPYAMTLQEKGINEAGEIVVRAASFADFNWGDPAWQDRVLTQDGWYRTGDLGYIDSDGYVFLAGRVDNQIATGGIKVSAEEIEQAIGSHAEVLEVGVIGVDDPEWGQRIVAIVVPRGNALTSQDLNAWCRAEGRLANYKCPKAWYFSESLPLTSVGKLDRKALRRYVTTRQTGEP